MPRSRHSLHPLQGVGGGAGHAQSQADRFTLRFATAPQRDAAPGAPGAPDVVELALKTVSLQSSFDAYIEVTLAGAAPGSRIELVVDSGNSTLILPRWEDIESLQNAGNYVVLVDQIAEPWGCPAKVVKGPIVIPAVNGSDFTIGDGVFYACTANAPDGTRTANFGAACLAPWTTSGWNTPAPGVVIQSPLSYGVYTVSEFDYAAAYTVHSATGVENTDFASRLYLYRSMPSGYQVFEVLPNLAWMCLTAKALSIGGR